MAYAALAATALAQGAASEPPRRPARPGPSQDAPAGDKSAGDVTLNAEQRATLYKVLAESGQHGFEPEEFAPANLGDMLRSKNQDEVVKAQELLVSGVIRYARAQHGGRAFHGDEWPKEWALRPQPYDAEREFAFAVKGNKLQAWLDSLPPPFARYRALKAALASTRNAPVPQAHSARHGKTAKRGGKESAPAHGSSNEPAPVSNGDQVRALVASMERWRWMPRDISPDRVEVNTAADLLQVYQGGKPTLGMKTAAGKPGDETPILTSSIDSIVFNPAWHVPKSIAEKELYPKNKRHPGYFEREGFINSKDSESGLLQKPGPKNALGQIKFDFKNPFAVYLHDTPAQSAFDRSSRNVSHGCVRIEKPVDLAALLLQGTPDGNPQEIQTIIAGDTTKRVEVPKAMPVFLLYWTAFVGDGNQVQFRKDIYGWDAKLMQLLAAGRQAA